MWLSEQKSSFLNSPKQNWSDLILRGAADGEEFTDVRLITLRSHYEDTIEHLAMNVTYNISGVKSLDEQIQSTKESMRNKGKIQVKQFVEHDVENNTLTICIDVPKIDDNTINVALDALAEIEFSFGTKVEFGEPKTFAEGI
jgi:hypothetical protein